jgi:hypothetical protein
MNPYEEELMRRRQMETNQPQFQQPAPMANLPLYAGPEQAQWVPMDSGQTQDFSAAGAGMADLIKRFKKPGTAMPSHLGGSAMGHNGTGGGIGPVGHGY